MRNQWQFFVGPWCVSSFMVYGDMDEDVNRTLIAHLREAIALARVYQGCGGEVRVHCNRVDFSP